ncbi:MAG: CorA family divalent cation transporter [Sulfuricurvum sp.]|nr:CorA family divalent cation transporter [Sulfuricurvum sp.]
MVTLNGINLHDLHVKDLKNPIHPSVYESFSDYQILILRLPELWEGKANILSLRLPEFWEAKGKFLSYGFVITQKGVCYYDKKTGEFINYAQGMKELYLFLDAKIDALMDDIDMAQEKIAFIEEGLYKKHNSTLMDRWHGLKKELSRSERVIVKAVDTLGQFITKSKLTEDTLQNEFNDLHEHLERTLRSTISANNQLDDLYRYYNLRSNDRMNRSIYVLTIVSVIFLPLNLAVGFFGMNTGGLPFQNTSLGTVYAFESMILFAVLLIGSVVWTIKKE